MNEKTLMGPWVRRFLLEHLVSERNLSHNTRPNWTGDVLFPGFPNAGVRDGCYH
jgi:hypothetical protein